MAWIESHQSLLTHRKTGRLARALGISKATAIGHLHIFWWWCMDNAPSGDLVDMSDGRPMDVQDVSDGAAWDGDATSFFDAMLDARFIEKCPENDDCYRVHDWMEFAGKLITRRREDAQRKRNKRLNLDVQGMSDGRPSDGVRTQPNPTVPNQTVSSNEETHKAAPKRPRVRVRSQSDDNRTMAFEALWDDYPRSPDGTRAGTKARARKEFDRISPADWDRVSDALAAYKDTDKVKRGFVLNAENWLKGDTWRQYLEQPKPPAVQRGNGRAEKTRFEATEEYFSAIFNANTNGAGASPTPIDRPRLRGGPPETA